MPQRHSPGARAGLQTGLAERWRLPGKSPAASSIPDPTELWDAAHSEVIAASAEVPGTLRYTPHSPTNGPAARASPCPSLLHPDMARTAVSPGGTSVLPFSLCPSFPWQSWHHLGPSTPSSYLCPSIFNFF